MNDGDVQGNGHGKSGDFPLRLRAALALLQRGLDCARDAQADPWDFALEIGELYAAGLTITDLRWMVAKGFVEHANETTIHGDSHRSFASSRGFSFLPTTCMLLTAKGAVFAAQEPAPADEILAAKGKSLFHSPAKPRWDAARRELSLGALMVKRFHVPARNQELVLSTFQRDDWPESIDDPLADEFDVDPKIRLNDVVYRLNHKQLACVIRFHVNGHGRSVHWSLRAPQAMRRHGDAAAESRASV